VGTLLGWRLGTSLRTRDGASDGTTDGGHDDNPTGPTVLPLLLLLVDLVRFLETKSKSRDRVSDGDWSVDADADAADDEPFCDWTMATGMATVTATATMAMGIKTMGRVYQSDMMDYWYVLPYGCCYDDYKRWLCW
jgi:hypothetical protein